MPPKKRPRVSQRAAESGKQILPQREHFLMLHCDKWKTFASATDKAGNDETVSSAKEAAAGSKKEATGKTKGGTGSDGPPEYSHWLMKSEPESRFENGIDMKVQSSIASESVLSTVAWTAVM